MRSTRFSSNNKSSDKTSDFSALKEMQNRKLWQDWRNVWGRELSHLPVRNDTCAENDKGMWQQHFQHAHTVAVVYCISRVLTNIQFKRRSITKCLESIRLSNFAEFPMLTIILLIIAFLPYFTVPILHAHFPNVVSISRFLLLVFDSFVSFNNIDCNWSGHLALYFFNLGIRLYLKFF